jgi:FtsZ-binding cell division protein ZapB
VAEKMELLQRIEELKTQREALGKEYKAAKEKRRALEAEQVEIKRKIVCFWHPYYD